ncbi:protein of unknown function (plasmid) [Cupriavidus taiwanensis]|uniref:Uncharacterized protein n=1 Tax=Cupriavidus taiwanensis TaxID=164546 RepID=A0A375EEG6_9BURK|nr:protein of unknown function [Cupriavidus taiwanensis]SOZ72183.1 protein of unknown function [Cupriavidus taiwanensis]SOZ74482.1 protein of unknown function [Cupriavidus taiwanensis]
MNLLTGLYERHSLGRFGVSPRLPAWDIMGTTRG